MESIIKNYIELKRILENKYILIGEDIDDKNGVNEKFKSSIWLTPCGILEVKGTHPNYIEIGFIDKPFGFSCITRTAEIKKE